MGGERDTRINTSTTVSMTEFREVNFTRHLGGGREIRTLTDSAVGSMTEFREVKSATDDLTVDLEVKDQMDKDVSQSHSPVTPVMGGERDTNMNISTADLMKPSR